MTTRIIRIPKTNTGMAESVFKKPVQRPTSRFLGLSAASTPAETPSPNTITNAPPMRVKLSRLRFNSTAESGKFSLVRPA